MDQSIKNITLMVLLGILVLSSIILGLTKETSINTIEHKEIFSLQDTSKVDLISIKSKTENIHLQKVEGEWILNEQYKAEQNIVKVLLSILKDVEVVRNVPKSQAEILSDHITENGFLVEISGDGKIFHSFYAAGNNNKTVSYMMPADENSPMIVNIPGYESYVAGIFEIPTNDWRDRVLLSTNWRSLQNLQIEYTEFPDYNLNIKFEFNFLKIEGITNLDTLQMMDFIGGFQYLQTDRYLEKGQNARYDSLLGTSKTVTLTIEDINAKNSKTIHFYPLIAQDPMMLGYVEEDEQMVLFEANRIQKLFAVKADFEANTKEGLKN
jgi:hypothetical protein